MYYCHRPLAATEWDSRLLAILLGRLRLDIKTSIKIYLKLSECVFQPNRAKLNWFGRTKDAVNVKGRFNSDILEAVIKEVVREYGKESEEALLFQKKEGQCKM
jgi:hypothetical protein